MDPVPDAMTQPENMAGRVDGVGRPRSSHVKRPNARYVGLEWES
jgi:hypothetical protein